MIVLTRRVISICPDPDRIAVFGSLNTDLVNTRHLAPGSELLPVWKNAMISEGDTITENGFNIFGRTAFNASGQQHFFENFILPWLPELQEIILV
jgi:hypothetical protein